MIFKRKCKITFIRHGATINTEENRLNDDGGYPPLNSVGKLEIEKIAHWMKNKGLKIDTLYTSPALRCVQSGRIISDICNHDAKPLTELTSKKAGIWSGLTFNEIEKQYPQMLEEYHKDSENFLPKDGESVKELNIRVKNILNKLVEENLYKRLVIVTHAEIIQSAIANALNIPVKNQFKVYIPTGSATQINYYEDFSSLVYSGYLPL